MLCDGVATTPNRANAGLCLIADILFDMPGPKTQRCNHRTRGSLEAIMHRSDAVTEGFIQRENLKMLRALLLRTTDKAECQRIVSLIEEEEAKKQER